MPLFSYEPVLVTAGQLEGKFYNIISKHRELIIGALNHGLFQAIRRALKKFKPADIAEIRILYIGKGLNWTPNQNSNDSVLRWLKERYPHHTFNPDNPRQWRAIYGNIPEEMRVRLQLRNGAVVRSVFTYKLSRIPTAKGEPSRQEMKFTIGRVTIEQPLAKKSPVAEQAALLTSRLRAVEKDTDRSTTRELIAKVSDFVPVLAAAGESQVEAQILTALADLILVTDYQYYRAYIVHVLLKFIGLTNSDFARRLTSQLIRSMYYRASSRYGQLILDRTLGNLPGFVPETERLVRIQNSLAEPQDAMVFLAALRALRQAESERRGSSPVSGGNPISSFSSSPILSRENITVAGTESLLSSSPTRTESLRSSSPTRTESLRSSSPVSAKEELFITAWQTLVESGEVRRALDMSRGEKGTDRRTEIEKIIVGALKTAEVNNRFITERMKKMLAGAGAGEVVNAGEVGQAVQAEWEEVQARIGAWSEVYFEDEQVVIYYKGTEGEQALVRMAPDNFVDYLTDSKNIYSYFNQGMRVDVVVDAEEVRDMQKDLAYYAANPEFYQLVYDLNSTELRVALSAVQRLKEMLAEREYEAEAARLLTAALGVENYYVQTRAQEILNHYYSGRPAEFPETNNVEYASLGEEYEAGEMVVRVGFNPLKDEAKLRAYEARLVVAGNNQEGKRYYALEVKPETDNSVRLTVRAGEKIKAEGGVMQLAVEVKGSEQSGWRYLNTYETNVTVYVAGDLRGKMIYQAWPSYLGVYGKDGKVLYDENGRAIPGTFKTVEAMLPKLAERRYTHIYVMGVYQLDKPENIIGQVGPDASLFSPLELNISKELGGEEGLRELIKAAGEYGIEIMVDLIPHVNQNFSQLPEWSIVKARAFGKIVRRLATDGSVDHETGKPVEWHDSVLVNWRDSRVLRAYGELLERLAGMGVTGVRVDIAHNFGTMLPVDRGVQSKQKLLGNITSWERQASGGFKVVNDWDLGRGNPLLVYLVTEVRKRHPGFVFVGENYGRDIQIAKSGVMPMDSGTYSDLKEVIVKGASTQNVLNGHFRWMFGSLPKGAQYVGALETHDFYRVMDRWQHYGPYRLKAAIWTWLSMTRGPILIYNRQEIGEVHRIRIDNYTKHNYDEADRMRYYAQLEFEGAYNETVEQFYDRALGTYVEHEAISKGRDYIIDTHHDRLFAVARYDENEGIVFVVNEWWETAYAELDLGPLWAGLKVTADKEEFYIVKDMESGREEVFTGEELMAEGLRMKLGSYQAAVLSIKKVSAREEEPKKVSSPVTVIQGRAIHDAMLRYNEQYRPRRQSVNYVFRWLEEVLLSGEAGLFEERFGYVAHLVEGKKKKIQELHAADITVIIHDLIGKHPQLRGRMAELLGGLAKTSDDHVVKAVAGKALRWMDVGVVVFVSPEAVPLYKAGGMANVVGELADFLAESGLKMYVVTPRYQNVDIGVYEYTGKVANIYMGRHGYAAGVIAKKRVKKVEYLLLDNPSFGDALYGQASKEHESLRAIFLSLGALEAMKVLNIHPTIVAGHDWMTAPLMAHLNSANSLYKKDPHFANTKTIGWVHNNGQDYQFKVEREQDGVDLLSNLGLPPEDYGWFIDPHRGDLVNFMSGFIRHAGKVIAVSPGQLQDYLGTDDKGGAEGFRGIFNQLADEMRLFALTNGIFLKERQRQWFGMSYADVHSEEDKAKFLDRALNQKAESKRIMAEEHPEFWGASGGKSGYVDENHLVVNLVSRIVEQKGIQYIPAFVRRVIESGKYPDVSFVFAGTGDSKLSGQLSQLAQEFAGRVGFFNGFLSAKDQSGVYYHTYMAGDVFISLSTFEPGGISPMEGLASGEPCLVSDKQGHKSTVKALYVPEFAKEMKVYRNEAGVNGARFPLYDGDYNKTVDNIMVAFDRLYQAWKERETNPLWYEMVTNALMSDNSWEKTGELAEALFKFTLGQEEHYQPLAEASMLTGRKPTSSPVRHNPASSPLALSLVMPTQHTRGDRLNQKVNRLWFIYGRNESVVNQRIKQREVSSHQPIRRRAN